MTQPLDQIDKVSRKSFQFLDRTVRGGRRRTLGPQGVPSITVAEAEAIK
jgi:hypothetical protein